MPLLDTRQKEKDLTGTFIADLVLQILSYVAETERRNIRQRQAEGIAAAKEGGVRFGNPGKPLPKSFPQIIQQWRAKEITLKEALSKSGISRTCFYEKAKKFPKFSE